MPGFSPPNLPQDAVSSPASTFPSAIRRALPRGSPGAADPLALWDWFAAHLEDTPKRNNRFDLAGRINAAFPRHRPVLVQRPPTDIPGLPRKGRNRQDHGMAERRLCETAREGRVFLLADGRRRGGRVAGDDRHGHAVAASRAVSPARSPSGPSSRSTRRSRWSRSGPRSLQATCVGRRGRGRSRTRCRCGRWRRASTRCSGRAVWLPHSRIFPPAARREEGWIFGLGTSTAESEAA